MRGGINIDGGYPRAVIQISIRDLRGLFPFGILPEFTLHPFCPGQIEFTVNYHDKKSDNWFTITTTNDLNEAVAKLKTTLEGEVASLQQKV